MKTEREIEAQMEELEMVDEHGDGWAPPPGHANHKPYQALLAQRNELRRRRQPSAKEQAAWDAKWKRATTQALKTISKM